MPGLLIERLPIADLLDDPGNARRHDQRNHDAIVASLTAFGQVEPLVVQKSTLRIIGGHGRRAAMLEIGWTDCDAVRLDVDDSRADALAVALNRTAELGSWDQAKLAAKLESLSFLGFDLGIVGFTDDEALAIGANLSDETMAGSTSAGDDPGALFDQAAALKKKWKTARGQLWTIGKHRLLCGDCTKADDVARVMGGDKAVMMCTDPPYGVNYARTKNGIPRSGFAHIQADQGDMENDDLTDGADLQAFLEAAIRAAVPHLSENPAFYFWHPMLTQGTFFAAAAAAAAADILIHRQIIWVKPGFILTRSGMYHWKHELCFYGWVRGKPCPWYGDKSQTSVWEVGRDQETGMHLTQKPVELFLRPIANHTKPGEVIYEPFAGSGTQFVAAEQTARRCFGLEIEPKYVAVILERLAGMGLKPELTKSP